MSDQPAWLRMLSASITGRENLATVIRYTSIVSLGGHLLFIGLFLWAGVWPMAVFNVGSSLLFLLCYFLSRNGRTYWAVLLGGIEIIVHAIVAVACLGWDSGFAFYIFGLTPLVFYSQRWRLSAKVWFTSGLCLVFCALFVFAMYNEAWAPLSRLQLSVAGVLNAMIMFLVVAALAFVFRLSANTVETELTQANLALEQQANTDPLTHLANRRQMQEHLEQAIREYQASHTAFCIILSDIDDFKAFNDYYGHEAGDAVLIQVADAMHTSLREQDRVARWGGEEFLILLSGTRLPQAKLAAERILEKVAARRVNVEGRYVAITMTMGVAEYTGESDPTSCIKRADAALYIGKSSGKNQVVTLMDLLYADSHAPVGDDGPAPDHPQAHAQASLDVV